MVVSVLSSGQKTKLSTIPDGITTFIQPKEGYSLIFEEVVFCTEFYPIDKDDNSTSPLIILDKDDTLPPPPPPAYNTILIDAP